MLLVPCGADVGLFSTAGLAGLWGNVVPTLGVSAVLGDVGGCVGVVWDAALVPWVAVLSLLGRVVAWVAEVRDCCIVVC